MQQLRLTATSFYGTGPIVNYKPPLIDLLSIDQHSDLSRLCHPSNILCYYPQSCGFWYCNPVCQKIPLLGPSCKGNCRLKTVKSQITRLCLYCWGDQSHPQSVKLKRKWRKGKKQPRPAPEPDSSSYRKFSLTAFGIHSGHLDIGPNLASALRALQYRYCKRLLWCDSICINQKEVAERSAQVQRMADLYQSSRRVIVWLGPAAPWSTTAMGIMRWVRNQLSSPAIDISSYEGVAPNFAPTKDGSL